METIKVIPADKVKEWRDKNYGGISPSDAVTICGHNPYDTPYQLWCRRKHCDPQPAEGEGMRSTRILADSIATYFQEDYGLDKVCRIYDLKNVCKGLMVSNELDFMYIPNYHAYFDASAAGSTLETFQNHGVLLCKSTMLDIDPENVPLHWQLQINFVMGMLGMRYGTIAWLRMGRFIRYRQFKFNPDLYETMGDHVNDFFNDNLIMGVEPELSTEEDANLAYEKTVSDATVANEQVDDWARQLRQTAIEQIRLDTKVKTLRLHLKDYMGSATTLLAPDGETVLATWKTSSDSKRLNAAALKADEPEIYQKYLTTVKGTRHFILK